MPRRSFDQLPLERRQLILTSAIEEFAAHGYQGTSYNQLLARLGIGKSSAYHYFEDKADLFQTAVADCYVRFFEGLAELREPSDRDGFWSLIRTAYLRGFRFMLESPNAAALMQCLVREAPLLEGVLGAAQILDAVYEHHRRFVLLGQSLGAVRTDLSVERLSLLSRSIASAADQAFVEDLRQQGEAAVAPRLETLAAEWVDTLQRVLEPRA